MRRLALAGAWVLVVVLTTLFTWQIVSAAGDRVTERPASPLNAAAPQTLSTVPGESSPTSSVPVSTTSPPLPETTVTTAEPAPTTTIVVTTTEASDAGETTTTTIAPSTTTTTSMPVTTTEAGWSLETTSTEGGTVVVKHRPEEVILQTATPAPGFSARVEKAGPPTVEVDFVSEELSVEYRAEWEDGELEIDVSESEESDPDED